MTDFYAEQLKFQIECGPFSESFTVDPEGQPYEIRGIFDVSVVTNESNKSTRPVPRIILFAAPEYEADKTLIAVRGKTYTMQKHETDANTGTVVFLR